MLAVARIAGIAGAKRTSELLPLAHVIGVHGAVVDLVVGDHGVDVTATVRTADRTGVEMEALTAVAVAGLAVVDMVKGLDKSVELTDVRLVAKTGASPATGTASRDLPPRPRVGTRRAGSAPRAADPRTGCRTVLPFDAVVLAGGRAERLGTPKPGLVVGVGPCWSTRSRRPWGRRGRSSSGRTSSPPRGATSERARTRRSEGPSPGSRPGSPPCPTTAARPGCSCSRATSPRRRGGTRAARRRPPPERRGRRPRGARRTRAVARRAVRARGARRRARRAADRAGRVGAAAPRRSPRDRRPRRHGRHRRRGHVGGCPRAGAPPGRRRARGARRPARRHPDDGRRPR